MLTDMDPCPVHGKNYGRKMELVSDSDLIWLYEQSWLKKKYPEVYEYIVRAAPVIEDLILRPEDQASGKG